MTRKIRRALGMIKHRLRHVHKISEWSIERKSLWARVEYYESSQATRTKEIMR